MKYSLIVLVFLFFSSCRNEVAVQPQGEVVLLQAADTNMYTGVIVKYYAEGDQKKIEEVYRNGNKNGGYTSWFKNGTVKIKGKYQNNKRVGVWSWFTEQGKLQYSLNYNKS